MAIATLFKFIFMAAIMARPALTEPERSADDRAIMFRRWSAFAAIVAVLCGFGASPYTHAHRAIDSVADDHHPHGATLVHSHSTPHEDRHDDESGGEPDHDDARKDRIWSVAPVVGHHQATSIVYVPLIVDFAADLPLVEATTLRMEPDRPRAHAPPLTHSLSLRAPPSLLPISF